MTKALSSNPLQNLKNYVDTCTHQLNEIVKLVRGKLSTQNRTTLGTKKNEKKKRMRQRRRWRRKATRYQV